MSHYLVYTLISDLQRPRIAASSTLTRSVKNLDYNLILLPSFSLAEPRLCPCHLSSRVGTRPSVEEIAEVHGNFCSVLPLSLTNLSAAASRVFILTSRCDRIKGELFPSRRSCLQFLRKPSNFELFADVCENCTSRLAKVQ